MAEARNRRWRLALRNLPIRYKLLLGYTTSLLAVLLISQGAIYVLVRSTVQRNIESELETTTQTIVKMVRTSAHVSVRNRLRAIAEKNEEIVRYFYEQSQNGKLTEEEARARASEVLLSQSIGYTGYIYCLNSRGVLEVHPKTPLVGKDISEHGFIQDQVTRKQGYVEYDWKNPGEPRARAKALYMTYFEPWDWIISASSYRDEFATLVDVEDFRHNILAVKFGDTGYTYVLSGSGDVVIHPNLTGNVFNVQDSNGVYFVREMCERKNGVIAYTWQNPGESSYRDKLAYFTYLPDYDWVVVSSSYHDEFFAPVHNVQKIFFATTLLTVLLLVPLTLVLGSTITKPIALLRQRLQHGTEGDLSVRADVRSTDEVGELGRYFNHFMDRLEQEREDRLRAEAEQARIAERLRQGEKLEAVGQLAGGVAHDFNNILGAILGHAELLQMQDLSQAQLNSVEQIISASSRAAGLTRSLLDFSRKSALRTDRTIVDDMLRDVTSLLRHSIDKRIRVETDLQAPRVLVQADPSRLQNAFLNLALNARDAMPRGGVLKFATRLAVDPDNAAHGHLEVVVSDTGIGMDEATLERVFEPFFTTKEQGKGTGLGLASVYGCVQAHDGDIEVASQPDVGTVFTIRLPIAALSDTTAEAAPTSKPLHGSGHILVVDDEDAVRDFARQALATLGYTTTGCADGIEAVAYLRKHVGEISLVLLDLVMPGIDGRETFHRLREADPNVRVLFCSGHTERSGSTGPLPDGAQGFIQKPYRIQALAAAVADALGQSQGGRQSSRAGMAS